MLRIPRTDNSARRVQVCGRKCGVASNSESLREQSIWHCTRRERNRAPRVPHLH